MSYNMYISGVFVGPKVAPTHFALIRTDATLPNEGTPMVHHVSPQLMMKWIRDEFVKESKGKAVIISHISYHHA